MNDPNQFLPLSPHQFHILLALTGEDRHGYAIIQEVDRRTEGTLRLGTGTLYTAIARLVALGLISDTSHGHGKHGQSQSVAASPQERRRYYRLLPLGKSVLRAETARLETLVRHAHAHGIQSAFADASARPRRRTNVGTAPVALSRRS